MQGETNLEYLNLDVCGNFALAGSIFLDTRNERDFSDPHSILYGHHMENSAMFGDLDLYKDEECCLTHAALRLYTPEVDCGAAIFAAYTVNG